MTDPCEHWHGLIALKVAGQLRDVEPTLERHLEGCPGCRRELEELESVGAALALVDVSRLAPETTPPGLEQRILAASRPPRRNRGARRWGRHLAPPLAAAAAAAAATALAFVVIDRDPEGPPTEPVAFAQTASGVGADGSLIAHTWGVEVKLVLTGLAEGERYEVDLIREDGTTVPAGTFVGVADRPVVCNMNGALLREDAVGVSVSRIGGPVVARGTFS